VHPNNQNLGATAVQAFVFEGAVRNNNSQYYHHRNLTIKPVHPVQDSVNVRFYFLDSETDTLVKANDCASCSKPASAYELGISKYTDPDKSFENGNISDNQQGIWQFIQSNNVRKVPFDKGYYAEFKVKDFSEFWLNGGGMDKSTPLPVKMMDFSAQKSGVTDVLLHWKVGAENNVLRYEIEVARGNTQLQAGQFQQIAQVPSMGNTTTTRSYSFTDATPGKMGAQYYRIKIINGDGSFLYSPVRSVVFDEPGIWQVFPNPSTGVFFLMYQAANGAHIEATVFDSKGRVVLVQKSTGTGFPQKLAVDLNISASGVYLLQVASGEEKRSFKLYKQ
jgi:hypothetical protein